MTKMHTAIEEAIREEIGKPEGDLTKGDFEYLRELKLIGNQISDVTPLKDLTQLTWLYLGHNQISESGIEDLQKALPECNM